MILRFILSHLWNNIVRTGIIITTIFLSSVLSFFLVFLYLQILNSAEYYTIGNVNPLRFEISRSSSILSILNSEYEFGIDQGTLNTIEKDETITDWYVFSLVNIPAIIRVEAFWYALETDVPFFTASDRLFCGTEACTSPTPVWFSRLLLDFYNLNIAGTAEFFPKIPEALITSHDITLTLGTSKVFDYNTTRPYAFSGRISAITPDFPSMGITIPESVGRTALASLGKSLDRPFRLIWYAHADTDIEGIRSRYGSGYQVRFDTDRQAQLSEKLTLLHFLFAIFTIINIGVLTIIMSLFIFDILRQYSPLFRTFRMIGVPIHTNFLIVMGEILIAWGTWILAGFIVFAIVLHFWKIFLLEKFVEVGIVLPLIPLDPVVFTILIIFYLMFLVFLAFLISAPKIFQKWERGADYE